MTSIEERIVSLGFNNKSFEQHAAQSMSTLDKLDHMLDSFGGSKGMSLLTNALESVTNKFSVMGTIGDQALRRIADTAMNAANSLIQMGKSMSIDQITAGWGKYEQKTASVQTIMNATGDSIEKVNEYLSDLMWYSDETSFGFTDMTSALGQMTSSGGKVENLIPLLMGVGNAVAYAGKGASEFSRVVYNLNQSYGAGALQLMDWKSLELAGVASKELKQAFIDVAIAQGKINEGDVTIANFSQTLSKKWADTAVIEAAFGKFAEMTTEAKRLIDSGVYRNATEAYQALASKYGEVAVKAAQSAQEAKSFAEAIDATKDAVSSGWLTTFEHIFGNYEEAKVLWTDLTDVFWEIFAAGAEMRNEVLEKWHNAKVGGYQTLIEALENIFEVITKLTNLTRGGLLKILFGNTGQNVYTLVGILVRATNSFKQFSDDLLQFVNNIERFNVFGKIFTGLRGIFVGLKVPISLVGKAIHEVLDPLFTYNGNQIKWPRDLAIIISQLATKFKDAGIAFTNWIRDEQTVVFLSRIARGLASIVDLVVTVGISVKNHLIELAPYLKNLASDFIVVLASIGERITLVVNRIKDSGVINRVLDSMTLAFKALDHIVYAVSSTIHGFVLGIIDSFPSMGGFVNKILDLVDAFSNWIIEVTESVDWFNTFYDIASGVTPILDTLFNAISKIFDYVSKHNPFSLLASGIQKAAGFITTAVGKIKDAFSSVFGTGNNLGGNVFSVAGTIGGLILLFKKLATGASIKKFVDSLNDILENGFGSKSLFGKFKETVGETLESVQSSLHAFANSTNA